MIPKVTCPYCACLTVMAHVVRCKQRDNSTVQLVEKCQSHSAHAVAIDTEGNVTFYEFTNLVPSTDALKVYWVRDQYMRDENAEFGLTGDGAITMDDMQEITIYLMYSK